MFFKVATLLFIVLALNAQLWQLNNIISFFEIQQTKAQSKKKKVYKSNLIKWSVIISLVYFILYLFEAVLTEHLSRVTTNVVLLAYIFYSCYIFMQFKKLHKLYKED